jgi:hypothetical protein
MIFDVIAERVNVAATHSVIITKEDVCIFKSYIFHVLQVSIEISV